MGDQAPDGPVTIWLSPTHGRQGASGSQSDPLPGLESARGIVSGLPPGSTVMLQPGYHGAAKIRGSNITIEAAGGPEDGAEPPTLSRLEVDGSDITIRGLTLSASLSETRMDGPLVTLGERRPSARITLENCFLYGTLDAEAWDVSDWRAAKTAVHAGRRAEAITLRNNHLLNIRFGLQIDAPHSIAVGNIIDGFSADAIRVTRDGIQVRHNIIRNGYLSERDGDKNHDDAIQCFLFNKGSGTVRGIEVIGNVIVAQTDNDQRFPSAFQGIGFFDGPLVNFVVKDNVLIIDHWHGVSLYDAQGCAITHNTCFARFGAKSERKPWVRLGQKKKRAKGNTVIDNAAHTFPLKDDPDVTQSANVKVTRALAEGRLREAQGAIRDRFGSTHPVSKMPRFVFWTTTAGSPR